MMIKLSEEKAEHAIALILRYGSLISTLIMTLGLSLLLVHGPPRSLSAEKGIRISVLFQGLIRLEPVAIMELGILLLLLTPVFRIVVAVASFALEREYKYVLISLGVLAVVLLSIGFAVEG